MKYDMAKDVALELGFKKDNYYTAKEKMFYSITSDGSASMGCVVQRRKMYNLDESIEDRKSELEDKGSVEKDWFEDYVGW